jgi:hypothetical protein
MNDPDLPTAACAMIPLPPIVLLTGYRLPLRQITTSATTANAEETPSTAALATADAAGWCCEVQRIPITDSATTMPVKTVIARRMAFRAVIGER